LRLLCGRCRPWDLAVELATKERMAKIQEQIMCRLQANDCCQPVAEQIHQWAESGAGIHEGSGDPRNPKTGCRPIVRLEKCRHHNSIDASTGRPSKQGQTVILVKGDQDRKGAILNPTILTGVYSKDAKAMTQKNFRPVLTVYVV